jgi:hypothetical protein
MALSRYWDIGGASVPRCGGSTDQVDWVGQRWGGAGMDGYIFLSPVSWPAQPGRCLIPTNPCRGASRSAMVKIPANQRARFPETALQPRGRWLISYRAQLGSLAVVSCIRVWRATVPALVGQAADGLGKGGRGVSRPNDAPFLPFGVSLRQREPHGSQPFSVVAQLGVYIFDRGDSWKEPCVSLPGRCCSIPLEFPSIRLGPDLAHCPALVLNADSCSSIGPSSNVVGERRRACLTHNTSLDSFGLAKASWLAQTRGVTCHRCSNNSDAIGVCPSVVCVSAMHMPV